MDVPLLPRRRRLVLPLAEEPLPHEPRRARDAATLSLRRAHSSSGLGHRPLTAAARVRIPYAPLGVTHCKTCKAPQTRGFAVLSRQVPTVGVTGRVRFALVERGVLSAAGES